MIKAMTFQRQGGYTLVELMVAVMLTSIVTVSIYKAYVSITTSYDVQDQVVELQQNSRVAMDRLIRELRMAAYDPDATAGAGFVAPTDSTNVNFTMDLDDSGVIDAANETVGYGFDQPNSELERDGTAVIDNVNALDFVFLDEDGAVTTTLADIRVVQVSMVLRTTNEDYGYTNTDAYTNLQGATIYTAPGDNFRRRLVRAQVKVRNMGL